MDNGGTASARPGDKAPHACTRCTSRSTCWRCCLPLVSTPPIASRGARHATSWSGLPSRSPRVGCTAPAEGSVN